MPKFQINKEEKPAYQPLPLPEPLLSIDSRLVANTENNNGSHKIYISAPAFATIAEHIGWGKNTDKNTVEQGGVLLGKVYFDEQKHLYFGIVQKALPAQEAQGTMAYLEIGHEVWKQMMDTFDELTENNEAYKDMQIIGWYHTHPNHLSVFMSGTDRNTQATFFDKDWQFAIVLNPHKKQWRAFYGKNADECQGFILSEADKENK
jgi:proteasome lid subunit RPN8/RPN11